MGHQRIGRLPRTRHWTEVVRLLAEEPYETARVAGAAIVAAQQRLTDLADERALPYCYWLLIRLTEAARGGDFVGDASAVGAPVQPDESMIGFIARLTQDVGDSLRRSPGAGPFAELAVQSFRSTLTATVGAQGRSLFGSTVEDLQRAFFQHSTEKGIGRLAHRFFGDFTARTLRYFLDREIGNHIGPAYGLTTVDDAHGFNEALETHARETARIIQGFAGEWYSLRDWRSDGQISREEATKFVGQAMKKICSELVMEQRTA